MGCSQQKNDIFSKEPRISPMTHYCAGRVLERQNDLLGAIYQYKKAIEADPKLVQAYGQIGVLYQRLNRVEEAQKILKQAIEKNPESAVLRNNFGFCCLLMNDYVGAEQQFQAALGLSPEFDQARMNLAIVLARLNRMDESVREFERVVTEDMAYYNVAVICMDMEDFIQAEWALQNALASNPDFGPAKANLPHVTQLASRMREKTAAPALSVDILAYADEIEEEPIGPAMMPVSSDIPENTDQPIAAEESAPPSWTAQSPMMTMTLIEEPEGTK